MCHTAKGRHGVPSAAKNPMPSGGAARGTTRSSAAKIFPFVLIRRDVARGTERCIGVGQIYDQYEEAKQPLERRGAGGALIAYAENHAFKLSAHSVRFF